MFNKDRDLSEGATNQGPRPGDFSLGSLQSRAMARARAQLRRGAQHDDGLDLVVVSIGSRFFGPEHRLGEWEDRGDNGFVRISHLPQGLSVEEADRIAREHGASNVGEVWNSRLILHNRVPRAVTKTASKG